MNIDVRDLETEEELESRLPPPLARFCRRCWSECDLWIGGLVEACEGLMAESVEFLHDYLAFERQHLDTNSIVKTEPSDNYEDESGSSEAALSSSEEEREFCEALALEFRAEMTPVALEVANIAAQHWRRCVLERVGHMAFRCAAKARLREQPRSQCPGPDTELMTTPEGPRRGVGVLLSRRRTPLDNRQSSLHLKNRYRYSLKRLPLPKLCAQRLEQRRPIPLPLERQQPLQQQEQQRQQRQKLQLPLHSTGRSQGSCLPAAGDADLVEHKRKPSGRKRSSCPIAVKIQKHSSLLGGGSERNDTRKASD